MSFIHTMMGGGLRPAAEIIASGALADRLKIGRVSCVDTTAGTARSAFQAELQGDPHAALTLYSQLARAGHAPRWALQRGACVAAVTGDWTQAASFAEELAATGAVCDQLVYAEVLMLAGNPAAATGVYTQATLGLLGGETSADEDRRIRLPANGIETLLEKATGFLRQGLYVRARNTLEDALADVDLLLSAHLGATAAEARSQGKAPRLETLAPLVKLGDILLRYLARASLASNLADALRKRQLRDDLAAWAAGSSEVDGVLGSERARLAATLQTRPNHAELQYRHGLFCRTTGDLPAAARAFRRVLAIHPGYTRAVARLGVTIDQLGLTDEAARIVFTAFDAPASTLSHYYSLALSTTDPHRFDRAVASTAKSIGERDEHDVRANLAVVLADLGLLDETRREWKDAAAAAPAVA